MNGVPAGGADVPFFGMSAPFPSSEGRIHADKNRRHVCATRVGESTLFTRSSDHPITRFLV